MKNLYKRIVLLFSLTLLTTIAYGQNRPPKGTVGLAASIQGNQTNIMFPIWVQQNLSIAPVVGLVHPNDSYTTVNLGIKPRFYQNLGSNFASYFGLLGILQFTSVKNGNNQSDILLGFNGGGEYFLDTHFSLGVEAQLNLLINDNSDNRITTGAAVIAAYYF